MRPGKQGAADTGTGEASRAGFLQSGGPSHERAVEIANARAIVAHPRIVDAQEVTTAASITARPKT
jgi:hypothetical protein